MRGPTRVEVTEFFELGGATASEAAQWADGADAGASRALLKTAPSCWLQGHPAGREARTERGDLPVLVYDYGDRRDIDHSR